MEILFISDNFPPEVNAPAIRTYDHCKEWINKGAKVTVITCAPNFPKGKVHEGFRNKFYQESTMDGIKVIRVWTYISANEGFFRRTMDFLSFFMSSFFSGLFVKCDVIVATSPQFFTAISGRYLGYWKRVPWVMEVRDLWPESLKAVDIMQVNIIFKYLEWQEKKCYQSANLIICVTDSFKAKIINKEIDASKIKVIKNGVDTRVFKPMNKNQNLLDKLGLSDKIILGYIGTHGMAHKLDFLLNCAKKLEHTNYHFLFIGDGAERRNLIRKKKKDEINNATMLESVSRLEVAQYISIIDIAVINLKKAEIFKTVIPSKIFENAAMGIPMLLGVKGEAKDILEKYNAGLYFEPENELDFLDKLTLISEPVNYEKFREGGKKLASHFDRTVLANDMLINLRGIVS